ncbi:MAG TPA: DUF4010 domain-containing protein, partial [Gemmatimonadales bacterium]|nr:DUF4010 domain-containing protein [Gemmatimonadales bacterium]
GVGRGYGYAGLLGGLISSTAVTLNFARRSRLEPDAGRGLALGVVGACTVLVVRVLGITFVLNPATGWALLPPLLLPFLAGALLTLWGFWAGPSAPDTPAEPFAPPANPLRLGSAIRLALLFQAAMMALAWVQHAFGEAGVLPLAALLGLTDMDALTLSMARLGAEAPMTQLAARAIILGILSNTLLKFAVGMALGTSEFRRYAGAGLAWLAAVTGIAFVLA